MTAAEKESKLKELKAAAYDALAAKQQAEQMFGKINEQIAKLMDVETAEKPSTNGEQVYAGEREQATA